MTIKVLVVDDSALIREVLTRTLGARWRHRLAIGTAADPLEARQKVKDLGPDVLTLDIEMPNMNGLAFLDKLMRLHPLPVVMVSTLTTKGASETLLALELGAVDFVAKPNATLAGLDAFGENLRQKVRAAAHSDVKGLRACARPPAPVHIRTAAGPDRASPRSPSAHRPVASRPFASCSASRRAIVRRWSSRSTCRPASPRALPPVSMNSPSSGSSRPRGSGAAASARTRRCGAR